MKNLVYDFTNMLPPGRVEDLNALTPILERDNKNFVKNKGSESLAFDKLLDASKELLAIKYTADKLSKKFENLIVVGVGGSDLGARAIISALKSQYHNQLDARARGGMRIYFCGDTTDPTPLEELLENIELEKSAIQVISKSGNTLETMSVFLTLREKLIKKVGKESHSNHIVVTTDPDSGYLKQISEEENYLTLAHAKVGGRFSVLSSTGLLAAACAGINIDELMQGASELRNLTKKNSPLKNSAFAFAGLHYLGYKNDKRIAVLMPYEYKLKEFGVWFRQLWAESLGKNFMGQTPLNALGPTDQHSLLQLLQDGPDDKQVTFITTDTSKSLSTPAIKTKGIEYFGHQNFSDLLRSELQATTLALSEYNRENGTITIPALNEKYLGQLFYFFELATFYSGELYEINAFDQPGVELSKKYIHALIGKPDMDGSKKQLQKKLNTKKYLA